MAHTEIIESLSQSTLWMANEAVKQGVKAYHEAKSLYDAEEEKRLAGQAYNFKVYHIQYSAVHVAAEVLWKLFATCTHDCLKAIEAVSGKKDGRSSYGSNPNEYLEGFMDELLKKGGSLRIRTVA